MKYYCVAWEDGYILYNDAMEDIDFYTDFEHMERVVRNFGATLEELDNLDDCEDLT